MTREPRIIKYEFDKFIEEGDYCGALWEYLKESGVLFNKHSKVKKTNFEKIKGMNIDEMVEWISSITDCSFCPMRHPTDVKCYEGCPDGIKKWLESEVRE